MQNCSLGNISASASKHMFSPLIHSLSTWGYSYCIFRAFYYSRLAQNSPKQLYAAFWVKCFMCRDAESQIMPQNRVTVYNSKHFPQSVQYSWHSCWARLDLPLDGHFLKSFCSVSPKLGKKCRFMILWEQMH